MTDITTTDGSDNTWTHTCADTGVLAPPSETATVIDTGAVVQDATGTTSSTAIF